MGLLISEIRGKLIFLVENRNSTWHFDGMNGFAAAIEDVAMAWFLVKVAVQEEEEPATTADDILVTCKFHCVCLRERESIEGKE